MDSTNLPEQCAWLLPEQDQNLILATKSLLEWNWEESSKLFSLRSDQDPNYASALCLVGILRYMMSFEEEHKAKTFELLNNAESLFKSTGSEPRKIIAELKDSKSVVSSKLGNKMSLLCADIIELYLENLQADCSLFHAILSIMSQDITGFVKGGWSIRKALKSYEKAFKATKKLFNAHCPNDRTFSDFYKTSGMTQEAGEFLENSQKTKSEPVLKHRAASLDSSGSETDIFHSIEDLTTVSFTLASNAIDENLETGLIKNLMSSVCFGYGTFNLGLSLLSPQILRLISFFGLATCDREIGLKCLNFSARSKHPVKQKQSSFCLLWYHLIAKSYLGFPDSAITQGVCESEELIELMRSDYKTTLVLYFRGRMARLNMNLEDGTELFKQGYESSSGQRELQVAFCYELGFSNIMMGCYEQALVYFEILQKISKWAPPFNYYLVAVCQGALKNLDACKELIDKATKAMKMKNNPLEQWVVERCGFLLNSWSEIDVGCMQLLVLELLYLWNTIKHIPQQFLKLHLKYCMQFLMQDRSVSFWISLCNLLQGSLFLQNDKLDSAKKSFEAAILAHDSLINDGVKLDNHIVAFASYEMACFYRKQKNIEETKLWINKAKALCKGFKMEHRLSNRIYAFSMHE